MIIWKTDMSVLEIVNMRCVAVRVLIVPLGYVDRPEVCPFGYECVEWELIE